MSRLERRARLSRTGRPAHSGAPNASPSSTRIDDIYATALAHYRRREFVPAQRLCRDILDRAPDHVGSLVLLGDMVQQDGRNKQAVKLLGQALALDPNNAAAHDNIAIAFQALGRRGDAIAHFTQALMLGLGDAESLVANSAAVVAPLQRLAPGRPGALRLADLLGAEGAAHLADEALLMALLQFRPVHDIALEQLLTAIRRGLLQSAIENDAAILNGAALEFFCTLAQQCFINEYVFALSGSERAQLQEIQARVEAAPGAKIALLDLIAAASYLPLSTLRTAPSLLQAASRENWPDAVMQLLTRQVSEPLEEQTDRETIAALTPIEDATSQQVQTQYEENPYPRWTTMPPVAPTAVADFLSDKIGFVPAAWNGRADPIDILIAGCGTGQHAIDTAQRFSPSRVLAIDMSRTSLAYAGRKTRALGLGNIDYGQADILKLGTLGRRFDLIEAVGVLHHLANPRAGWQSLLSLLRPNGLMFVGLYSALARRPLTAARALIAERGYKATADDIRVCRQELIARHGLPPFSDFASMSGCRDLLFNVMEHQFTLPQIAAFVDSDGLTFLGFEQLPPDALAQFQQQFPDPPARRDLAAWHAFEERHPYTFGNMYFFWVQKSD
jgi:SAM-dependent methyltransferase/tetratricopeptide (TPR) repeat protein